MVLAVRLADLGNQLLPLEDLPQPWEPDEIRYLEIDIEASAGYVKFLYANSRHVTGISIDAFIDGLTPNANFLLAAAEPAGTPLDINVTKKCYIVLKLSSAWNWHYQEDRDAVSLKQSYPGSYGGLVHVVPDPANPQGPGLRIPAGQAPGQTCMLVYFAAIQPPTMQYRHHLNLHVELDQGTDDAGNRLTLPIILDPDIRNSGGHGMPL